MGADREKLRLDVDSDLKKCKGFSVVCVTNNGKVTIYDYFEDLNEAEKLGLLFSMIDFAKQAGGADWDVKKEYEEPPPSE